MRNKKATAALTLVLFTAQSTGAADLLVLTAHAAPAYAFAPLPPAVLMIPARAPIPPRTTLRPAPAAESARPDPLAGWLRSAGRFVMETVRDFSNPAENPFLSLQSEALLATQNARETFDLYPELDMPRSQRLQPARRGDLAEWIKDEPELSAQENGAATEAPSEPQADDLSELAPLQPAPPPDMTRRITKSLGRVSAIMPLTQPRLASSKTVFQSFTFANRPAATSSAFMAAQATYVFLTSSQNSSNRRRVVNAVHVSRDPSRPHGYRNTWNLTYDDGSRETVTASPLVFDLSGGGVRTSARRILFDIIGLGRKDRLELVNDIEEGKGLLVFDADGDGISGENGLELFGNATDIDGDGRADGHTHGFDALEALVRRAVAENVIPRQALSRDSLGAADLAALGARYGLRMKIGGLNRSPVTLNQAGVLEIKLSRAPVHRVSDFDGQGNDVSRRPGAEFTRANGTSGAYEDVWFARRN